MRRLIAIAVVAFASIAMTTPEVAACNGGLLRGRQPVRSALRALAIRQPVRTVLGAKRRQARRARRAAARATAASGWGAAK